MLVSTDFPHKPLPTNARSAVYDTLKQRGFSRDMIKENYAFSGQGGSPIVVNALVFAHETRRDFDYTGMTVFNPANGNCEGDIARALSQCAAPFHLIHRDDNSSFSLWFSNVKDRQQTRVEPDEIQNGIAYDQIADVLNDYAADINPRQIIAVKQGREEFAHRRFRESGNFQLALWAIDVTEKSLVEHFGKVVNELHAYTDQQSGEAIPSGDVTAIAIQLLGAAILAQTGALGESVRQNLPPLDKLISQAHSYFPQYFNIDLFGKHIKATSTAYGNLTQLSYAGFAPDMLADLYREAYPDRTERRKLGRYDTPLYLTRRMWESIPVEFLPPDKRVMFDMTCGWGSFLIAGYERLSRLSDTQPGSLRKLIHGIDIDPFTVQLAALGLLISTLEDTWDVNQYDAMDWDYSKQQPTIVVGNPPFGGNRKTIPAKRSRYQSADRFLNRAIEALEPGGYLAMLMPQSFVSAEASPKVRENLLQKCDILEMWELPLGTFEDAEANTLAVIAKKKIGSGRSSFPVRVRVVQKDTLRQFINSGTFTASELVPNQACWTEESRKSAGSKNTFLMDYRVILSGKVWSEIQSRCTTLQKVAHSFSGAIKKKAETRERQDIGPNSKRVNWLTDPKTTVKIPFVIDYGEATWVNYPDEFRWPRLKNRGQLEGQKIILTANANPSWGQRVKVGIERRGYYVSDNFIVVAPTGVGEMRYLTLEAIAAVLGWKISNAWILEHLKHPKIPMRAVKTVPFPYLREDSCNRLTEAVRQIESIQTERRARERAAETIDEILKSAYSLDDLTYERLDVVYQWDSHPQVTLDAQPDPESKWKTSGVLDSLDPDKGLVTLWVSNFKELQTVPISALMPGWMLRPNAAFETRIPRTCVRQHNLSDVSWGKFYPQEYTYLTEDDLYRKLSEASEGMYEEPR